MRKLTRNEVLELRACKGMENGRMEFFDRAEKFYADDQDALDRLDILRELRKEIDAIPDSNTGAYGAYMKTTEMYYSYMDDMLKDMGYTAEDE